MPIEYDHIRSQKLYRPSEVQLSVVDVKFPRGLSVGYIPGVGDNVEPTLAAARRQRDGARSGDTGVDRSLAVHDDRRRAAAYGVSEDLVANNGRLLDFVRAGGTMVVQYGQYEMANPGILPYPITLSRPADRVTVETVPVRILDSAAQVLNRPNKIGPKDFDGLGAGAIDLHATHIRLALPVGAVDERSR